MELKIIYSDLCITVGEYSEQVRALVNIANAISEADEIGWYLNDLKCLAKVINCEITKLP